MMHNFLVEVDISVMGVGDSLGSMGNWWEGPQVVLGVSIWQSLSKHAPFTWLLLMPLKPVLSWMAMWKPLKRLDLHSIFSCLGS